VNCSKEIKKDFAYSSAAYAQIAEFLQLIGKEICTNPTALKLYTQDDDQIKEWQDQFSLAFNEKSKSSHILAKQVYFPLFPESGYHLLTPLNSSSLAHVIYDRIWEARRKDTPVNKAREEKTFSSEMPRTFHRTAILKATQTNHQNVSNLNGKRSGQFILLPAVPPQWQPQTKPPIHLKTLFNKQLAAQAREPLTELKNLLLAIKTRTLSVNLQRKQLIGNHIIDIAHVVFDYAAQIQGLKQHVGWSQESQLPAHQQYWLDPLRPDEDFQTARATLDWSSDVVIDFSKWINRHIKHKQLPLGTAHEKQWQKLFTPLLREFNALAEADIEISTMEVEA
jgi:CRISPR-associated protein Csy1